jgi:hypothetical protein
VPHVLALALDPRGRVADLVFIKKMSKKKKKEKERKKEKNAGPT